ncbi:ribosome-inactivating family protein [Streptomyces sp. NPDC127051]|uniref:ribosome-inactivating family protein n=1 Tax=Streptomyces sp. NPDC127051 TaxID=3347119 RepID=UPI003668EB24
MKVKHGNVITTSGTSKYRKGRHFLTTSLCKAAMVTAASLCALLMSADESPVSAVEYDVSDFSKEKYRAVIKELRNEIDPVHFGKDNAPGASAEEAVGRGMLLTDKDTVRVAEVRLKQGDSVVHLFFAKNNLYILGWGLSQEDGAGNVTKQKLYRLNTPQAAQLQNDPLAQGYAGKDTSIPVKYPNDISNFTLGHSQLVEDISTLERFDGRNYNAAKTAIDRIALTFAEGARFNLVEQRVSNGWETGYTPEAWVKKDIIQDWKPLTELAAMGKTEAGKTTHTVNGKVIDQAMAQKIIAIGLGSAAKC